MIKRQRIFITGRVQGVGFRPAVYSIAQKLGLSGFVYNDTKGVTIELQGKEEKIAEELVDVIFYVLDASRLACPTVDMDAMFKKKLEKNTKLKLFPQV